MKLFLVPLLFLSVIAHAQDVMTPELLWKLGRVGGVSVSPNGEKVVFGVTFYKIEQNKGDRNLYIMDADGSNLKQLTSLKGSEFNAEWHPSGKKVGFLGTETGKAEIYEIDIASLKTTKVSDFENSINGFKYDPTGNQILYVRDVKLDKTINEKYEDLPEANVHVFDDLMYRHWDSWHDYSYSHIFVGNREGNSFVEGKDIMEGERYDSPMNPFGGMEQITWTRDGKAIVYSCKKLTGKAYAVSTNSELYKYDISSGITTNLTKGMVGYDLNPAYSVDGYLAFQSMEEDGFESDKNDIIVRDKEGNTSNLTNHIDITVSAYCWGPKGQKIYFESVIDATNQLFELDVKSKKYRQITEGRHNYTSVAVLNEKTLIGTKQSMMAPNEIYLVDIKTGRERKLTSFNDEILAKLDKPSIQQKMIETTDGKEMLTWVILPPNFDDSKKYPTILYCQGGPQSAVSQFFSFRWNFHLMAAQGYIIVAPNRRGLPGFGQKWNDDISGDWGGQPMKDYLSAIDALAKEPYVDQDNLGCIGASYGGYSVYYLAGIHNGRFKTFISHCGLFNLESWYGSTEELFFANKDIGGPYWGEERAKSYDKFSPHLNANKWDTPIMVIHGEKDYRVPVTQGMEAFQVAQLKGIPSKFLYFPTESHWVLSPQNGLVWHREFFSWLDRWLK